MSKEKGIKYEKIVKQILDQSLIFKNIEKTVNSGAFWFSKGDLQSSEYLIEIKGTDNKSFIITTKIVNKIWEEALERNRLPILVILLNNKDYKRIVVIHINKKINDTQIEIPKTIKITTMLLDKLRFTKRENLKITNNLIISDGCYNYILTLDDINIKRI